MSEKIARLKQILDESSYTVALCGSGMIAEGGFLKVKKQERAYDLEMKYGYSAEEMFSSAFYNTRPEQFFEFYKREILEKRPLVTISSQTLAAMERLGKLQCIITGNVFENNQQAGCQNVINLHGSIYVNECPRCGRFYDFQDILAAPKVPLCVDCNIPIRPKVNLYGEMVDSQLMTRATIEVERAEVLLLLGTTVDSEVFANYVKYFDGKYLVVIHNEDHYMASKADLLFVDEPKNILSQLGYYETET